MSAFRRYNPEFRQMSSHRVAQHRALPHQELSGSMQHQSCLLIPGLCRHKTHRRPLNRFADRSRIVGVILAALQISLHIARRHQSNCVPEPLQLSAPMMRCRTRLDPNKAGRKIGKELQNLRTTDTLADYHRAIRIDTVNLKHRLRNIETNRANLAHGRLPSMWFVSTQPPFGTSMP